MARGGDIQGEHVGGAWGVYGGEVKMSEVSGRVTLNEGPPA